MADAGLILPATLGQHLGLRAVFDAHVDLGGAVGHAHVGATAMTLIHSALAGGDSIDNADVLRCGATQAILRHVVLAPSTLGSFLRSSTWGHARQLDVVSAVALTRACISAWLELVMTANTPIGGLQTTCLDGDLVVAEPKALRYRILHCAGRVVHRALKTFCAYPDTGPGRPKSPVLASASLFSAPEPPEGDRQDQSCLRRARPNHRPLPPPPAANHNTPKRQSRRLRAGHPRRTSEPRDTPTSDYS